MQQLLRGAPEVASNNVIKQLQAIIYFTVRCGTVISPLKASLFGKLALVNCKSMASELNLYSARLNFIVSIDSQKAPSLHYVSFTSQNSPHEVVLPLLLLSFFYVDWRSINCTLIFIVVTLCPWPACEVAWMIGSQYVLSLFECISTYVFIWSSTMCQEYDHKKQPLLHCTVKYITYISSVCACLWCSGIH